MFQHQFIPLILFTFIITTMGAACGDTDPDDPNSESTNDGEFVKPRASGRVVENPFERIIDAPINPESTRSFSQHFSAAEHMATDKSVTETWLYEDEMAAFRFAMVGFGTEIREKNLRVYVLINFEPVPFGVVDASSDDPDPFLSDEEILDIEERVDSHLVHFEPEVPVGLSIVIDPEHLQFGSANEMRLLVIEDIHDPSSREFNGAFIRSQGTLIHYGGSEPIEFDLSSPLQKGSPTDSPLRDFMISFHGKFLEPTDADLSYIDEQEEIDEPDIPPHLWDPFMVDASPTTVRGWISSSAAAPPGEYGDVFVLKYRFDNEEFEKLGLFENLLSRSGLESEEELRQGTAEVELEVDLDPGVDTGLVLIGLHGWFDHDDDPIPYYPYDMASSNALWLHYEGAEE